MELRVRDHHRPSLWCERAEAAQYVTEDGVATDLEQRFGRRSPDLAEADPVAGGEDEHEGQGERARHGPLAGSALARQDGVLSDECQQVSVCQLRTHTLLVIIISQLPKVKCRHLRKSSESRKSPNRAHFNHRPVPKKNAPHLAVERHSSGSLGTQQTRSKGSKSRAQ